MPEFLRLLPPQEALAKFLQAIPDSIRSISEIIPTTEAMDRILAQSITAPHPLPPFPRTTVDGYAVRAADTYGASSSLPAYLQIVGEIPMGKRATFQIGSMKAGLVHTGGMVPEDADAVVMLENTQQINEKEIEIFRPVAPGENVLEMGEDVKTGEVVLETGKRLRPQEIGGLMALGVMEVAVVQRPRVGILSTGNEVISPWEEQAAGQVRDVNSYTLAALVTRAGGQPIIRGIIPDRYQDLLQAAEIAHREDQIVVITAGSSVSIHDMTADVIHTLGEPGVLVHGISIRPGKPTILAVAQEVPVIGLPGNPVSALVIAGLFLVPIIHKFMGFTGEIRAQVPAKLILNLSSESGREDYVPVRLIRSEAGYLAEPVFGRSNLIFTLIRADGLIRIPPDATGLPAGADVVVQLF